MVLPNKHSVRAEISITERDSTLLEALTLRVRCLSISQIARYWWRDNADAVRNARARLRRFEAIGLVSIESVLARPIPALLAPIIAWRSGEPMPDFGPIAYHLKNRFSGPVKNVAIVIALPAAAHRMGGHPGRIPRRSEATHDLGLASVFLRFLDEQPAKARSWVPESELVKKRSPNATKIPDALLRTRSGKETVIEFGGEYSKAKLIDFHQDCAGRGRSYQLW